MNKYSYSIAFVLLSTFNLPTFAQNDTSVYKWVDSEKTVHYTDRPAPGKIVEQNIEEKIRKAAGLAAKTTPKEKNSQYDTEAEKTSQTKQTNNAKNNKADVKSKDEKKTPPKNTEPSTTAKQTAKQQQSSEEYKKKLAVYCEKKTENLNVLLQDAPVAWEEQGKTVLLSADQRKEKVKVIKTMLKEKCSK